MGASIKMDATEPPWPYGTAQTGGNSRPTVDPTDRPQRKATVRTDSRPTEPAPGSDHRVLNALKLRAAVWKAGA